MLHLLLMPQVLCELSQCSSLVFLDPLGSLLDWRCGEAAAAAATPAFMSGGVLLPQMLDSLTCQVRGCVFAMLCARCGRCCAGILQKAVLL